MTESKKPAARRPTAARAASAASMKLLVVRLEPGEDLKLALDELARRHEIEAGVIVTCVGSLRRAALRLADGKSVRTWEQPFEIVSLVGTLSATGGSHLHVGLAGSRGSAIGGHLCEGSLVNTTAEIAVGLLPDLRFAREPDERTGYRELKVSTQGRRRGAR